LRFRAGEVRNLGSIVINLLSVSVQPHKQTMLRVAFNERGTVPKSHLKVSDIAKDGFFGIKKGY